MASETMEKPEFSERRKGEGSSTQQAGAHPGIRGEMVSFGHQDGLLKCVNKTGAQSPVLHGGQREEQTAAKLEGSQTMRVSRVACWVLTRQPWWSKPVDFLRNRRGTSWRRRRRGQKEGSFKNEEA